MLKRSSLFIIVTLLFSLACNDERNALDGHMEKAIKYRKVSAAKAQVIKDEYASLPDSLQGKYATSIIKILEAGGDSSHIEVIRRRFKK